ncbi:hypothetical protein [Thermocladium modestius]|nr:hypothetical protein [Thermocladium modestius]
MKPAILVLGLGMNISSSTSMSRIIVISNTFSYPAKVMVTTKGTSFSMANQSALIRPLCASTALNATGSLRCMLDGEYSINSTLFKINYFRGNYTSFETMLEPGQALLIMVKLGPMKDVDVRERPVVANGEVKLGLIG